DPAGDRVRDRALRAVRAAAVLGRGPVVVVLAVRVEAVLVVVELGALDDDAPARVRARVAERAELGPVVAHELVADPPAGADVVAGVGEVARVVVGPDAGAAGVAREEPVLGGGLVVLEERGGRVQVAAPERAEADLAAAVAAVPPDLVAGVPAAGEEVAGRQVLDAHAAGLPDDDAVPAQVATALLQAVVLVGPLAATGRGPRLGAVHDHVVAAHSTEVQVRGPDQDGGGRHVPRRPVDPVAPLVVIAGPDQDPIAAVGRVHGRLDRPELALDAVVDADSEHAGVGSRGAGQKAERGDACGERPGAAPVAAVSASRVHSPRPPPAGHAILLPRAPALKRPGRRG